MGPENLLTVEDQKMIEQMLSGEKELPEPEPAADKMIAIGSKLHPIGYRKNLYGFVTAFKRGKIEISFTNLSERGGKPTKKWFKSDQVCRFEDREEVYKKIDENLKSLTK